MEALVWNIGSCRFDVKGEIQAENLQELNTDAKHSGGLIGSSVEVSVMGMEQSDQIIQPNNFNQPVKWEELIQ
jgi:hypothetical protein